MSFEVLEEEGLLKCWFPTTHSHCGDTCKNPEVQKNQALKETKKLRQKMKETEHGKLILLWTFAEQKSFPKVKELWLPIRDSGFRLSGKAHTSQEIWLQGLLKAISQASATAVP